MRCEIRWGRACGCWGCWGRASRGSRSFGGLRIRLANLVGPLVASSIRGLIPIPIPDAVMCDELLARVCHPVVREAKRGPLLALLLLLLLLLLRRLLC